MEQVWGIPREVMVDQLGDFQGFLPDSRHLDDLCATLEEFGSFRPRSIVEEDETFKQVIPYVAITCNGRVLVLRRLDTQGESRLHHRMSIGVGGHVNPEPPGERPLLVRGLLRELSEELELDDPTQLEATSIGWINDDSTAVGRVHLGLACRIETAGEVTVREKDRMEGSWREILSLDPADPGWETWSSILLPAIVEGIETCTD